ATVPAFSFFQAEDGIRGFHVTGVQTCALPILLDEMVRDDGRIDREELAITCRDGQVMLEGSLPSRDEHEILLGLLRDMAGVERRSEERRVGQAGRYSMSTVEDILDQAWMEW